MRKLTAICTLSMLCALSTSSFAQSFYKWVDDNGSTHYSDTVPPNHFKKAKKIQTINDTPSGTATPVQRNTAPPTEAQNNPTQPTNNPAQNAPESSPPADAEHDPRAQ